VDNDNDDDDAVKSEEEDGVAKFEDVTGFEGVLQEVDEEDEEVYDVRSTEDTDDGDSENIVHGELFFISFFLVKRPSNGKYGLNFLLGVILLLLVVR